MTESDDTSVPLEELFDRVNEQLDELANRQQELEQLHQQVEDLARRQHQLEHRLNPSHRASQMSPPSGGGGGGGFSNVPYGSIAPPGQGRPFWGANRIRSAPVVPQNRPRLPTIRIDVLETDDTFLLKADLPGFSRDDLSLQVSDHTLHLRASHADDQGNSTDTEDGQYLHRERHRTLTRSVPFPRSIEGADISASLDNGVLTVRVPKSEPTDAGQQIEID